MVWKITEKIIGCLFILAILYLVSQTILQGIDIRRIEVVKEEIRKEFEVDRRDLQKQIIRLELQVNNSTISADQRMDAIENNINKSSKDDNNNK